MNSGSIKAANRANKLAFALICALALLTLCSCARKAVRITREEALPLQTVIDAQAAGDAALYISAFPPDYIEKARASYELTEGVSLEDYIKTAYLDTASENAENNYGKRFGTEFLVHASLDHAPEENPKEFEKYVDYNVYDYTLNVNSVQRSVKIVGTLNKWGDDDESTDTAYFIFLQIDGKWYLHPMYFLITF